jgi:lipopolysaccharide export system permease protein
VAIIALLAMTATAAVSIWARPWGNRSLKTALLELAQTRASAGLKPQIFNDDFPGLVIYTEHVDTATDRLEHVLISDERDADERNTIFAREGTMVSDATSGVITLRLRDGFIHTVDIGAGSEYQTKFESYDVNLDLRQAFADVRPRDPKEMTLAQLAEQRAGGAASAGVDVEYHRKFSLPFACLVFALVAMPLGVQPVRAARARGFAVSLVMIFVYYLLLSAGQALAEQANVPAVIGLWIPNVVFGSLGAWLFLRVAREYTVVDVPRLETAVVAFTRRVVARLRPETAA